MHPLRQRRLADQRKRLLHNLWNASNEKTVRRGTHVRQYAFYLFGAVSQCVLLEHDFLFASLKRGEQSHLFGYTDQALCYSVKLTRA